MRDRDKKAGSNFLLQACGDQLDSADSDEVGNSVGSESVKLELQRKPTVDESTFGDLIIEGLYYCKTLEDAIRERPQLENESDEAWVKRWKIFGRTAIPARTYEVILAPSAHFGNRLMPHLKNVPGFSYVMLHPLNTILQSEGCIGVGLDAVDAAHSPFRANGAPIAGLMNSLPAFEPLLMKIKDRWAHDEQVFIEINNPLLGAN